jgi:hypothetical protein
MEYLIGALATGVVVLLYDKFKGTKPTKQRKETEDEQLWREKVEANNDKMMRYDINKAYRKVVNND